MHSEAPRNIDFDKFARAAEILKTISHPVRLEIIERLAEAEPLSVNDIQASLKATVEQSMLSHHLIKMKDKGLLVCEKRGTFIYYRLADRSILKLLDCMSQCTLL